MVKVNTKQIIIYIYEVGNKKFQIPTNTIFLITVK